MWDKSKCAICSDKASPGRQIADSGGQAGIYGAPLCERCFVFNYTNNDYASVLHPGKRISWSQVCIEAHLIICGGEKIPSAAANSNNHKSCTKCNFPYPYESGPAICKSCQTWDAICQ